MGIIRVAVAPTVFLLVMAAHARADQCQLMEVASLDITERPNGRLLVPMAIAGSQRLMLLELSAAFSGLTDATATALSLHRKPMPEGVSANVNGHQIVDRVRAPSMQLGHLGGTNYDFLLIPQMSPEDEGADGVLGLDIIGGHDVELDIAHHKLNIFMPSHCTGPAVYWKTSSGIAAIPLSSQKSGNIMATMQLDGKPVVVGFTSSPTSLMGMNSVRRIFGLDEASPNMQSVGALAEPIHRYPFKTLDADGITIMNPDILINGAATEKECRSSERYFWDEKGAQEVYRCYGGVDIRLGLSVLRKLHLYFAFGDKMLYATAADQP